AGLRDGLALFLAQVWLGSRPGRLRPIGDRNTRRMVRDLFLLAFLEVAFGVAIFGHFGARVTVTLVERSLVVALLFSLVHHAPEHGRDRRQRRFGDALGQERERRRQQNRAGDRLPD